MRGNSITKSEQNIAIFTGETEANKKNDNKKISPKKITRESERITKTGNKHRTTQQKQHTRGKHKQTSTTTK